MTVLEKKRSPHDQRLINEALDEQLAKIDRRCRFLLGKKLRTRIGSNGRQRIDAELFALGLVASAAKAGKA